MPSFAPCALLHALFFLISSLSFSSKASGQIHFRDLSYTTAKSEASWQQKKMFVYCGAHYCTGCKIMEEYTFTDPALSQYVNDEFLPVKVDIHSALGKEWVTEFNIASLPTLLVFDESGYLLQRLEFTYTGSSLLKLLHESTTTSQVAAFTISLPDTIPQDSTSLTTQQQLADQNSVKLLLDTVKTEEVASSTAENEIIVAVIVPMAQRDQAGKTAIEQIIPVKKLLTKGSYKLQLGQFTDYDKAADLAKQLQDHFHKEVFMTIDAKGHYRSYSLLVQGFADQREAANFLLDMGDLNLEW